MRSLRLTAIVVLILSIVYALWANNRYYSGVNTDHPKIVNTVEQLQISVEDPPEALLQGLSAWDATDGDLTAKIEAMIAERAAAKKAKDYARADAIRAELTAMGVTLKDTPAGTEYTIG